MNYFIVLLMWVTGGGGRGTIPFRDVGQSAARQLISIFSEIEKRFALWTPSLPDGTI